MTDLICRKTMMRCQTPGMCSPFGGCQPSALADCKTTQSNSSAAPRQPDGDWGWLVNLELAEVQCNCPWNPDSHDPSCPVYLRDLLSDAKRAIAELREELDAAGEIQAQQGRRNTELRAERDTLRQQIEDLELQLGDTEQRCESAGRNASAFEDRMGELQVENGKLREECERLRAVLEGAEYLNIDRLKALSVETCREVGRTVGSMTKALQAERDTLRQQLADMTAQRDSFQRVGILTMQQRDYLAVVMRQASERMQLFIDDKAPMQPYSVEVVQQFLATALASVADDGAQGAGSDQFRELAKANAAQLGEALGLIERYRVALDTIGGLSRALRVGGPDPMDLQGLSDALEVAVDTAHGALS